MPEPEAFQLIGEIKRCAAQAHGSVRDDVLAFDNVPAPDPDGFVAAAAHMMAISFTTVAQAKLFFDLAAPSLRRLLAKSRISISIKIGSWTLSLRKGVDQAVADLDKANDDEGVG